MHIEKRDHIECKINASNCKVDLHFMSLDRQNYRFRPLRTAKQASENISATEHFRSATRIFQAQYLNLLLSSGNKNLLKDMTKKRNA